MSKKRKKIWVAMDDENEVYIHSSRPKKDSDGMWESDNYDVLQGGFNDYMPFVSGLMPGECKCFVEKEKKKKKKKKTEEPMIKLMNLFTPDGDPITFGSVDGKNWLLIPEVSISREEWEQQNDELSRPADNVLLKYNWAARDQNGGLYFYMDEPQWGDCSFECRDSGIEIHYPCFSDLKPGEKRKIKCEVVLKSKGGDE